MSLNTGTLIPKSFPATLICADHSFLCAGNWSFDSPLFCCESWCFCVLVYCKTTSSIYVGIEAFRIYKNNPPNWMRLDLQEQVEKKGLLLGPWVSGEFGLVSGFSRKPSFVGVFGGKTFFFVVLNRIFRNLVGGCSGHGVLPRSEITQLAECSPCCYRSFTCYPFLSLLSPPLSQWKQWRREPSPGPVGF